MIEIKDKKECCGCTACMNICPTKAITMVLDEEGFQYPKVDLNKCIHCNACNKVCPFLNVPKVLKNEIYGCHTKDISLLMKSSSGGIFGELSKIILLKQGIVVGVDNEYKYKLVDNMKDMESLYSSKYVQANPNEIFKKVKENLENKKLVLFSGTPCTINGLKNYLKKDYENLYTCDVICHGVPSKKWLNKYKNSLKRKIEKINFRSKTKGWHEYSTCIYYKNKKYESLAIDNEYMKAFYNNFCLRESCYACKAKGENRASDITLGDYWGISPEDEIYNFYGNSIVIINTEKGKELLELIKNNLIYKEVTPIELKENQSYLTSAKRPLERNDFYQDVDKMSFKKIIKKYKLDINIIRKLKIRIKNILKG